MTIENNWPEPLPVAQVRIARPTDRLAEIVRFYVDGLGLRELFRFENHAGYSGVMLGLPGTTYHLEFTSHVDGSPGDAPSAEHLLVLYFDGAAEQQRVAARLREFGAPEVTPENSYWPEHGALAFADPDGWQVLLLPQPVFRSA
ncbi:MULTISPECIES: VOC family protein [unclassified Nocardia]|uniref:VOC family protein n=1 Tax=unclassified Nocardia TaxID=2637762 RepID=UPI001CE47E79|nr:MULTISPECIES: VOC family protein [unclassified Nocardia]